MAVRVGSTFWLCVVAALGAACSSQPPPKSQASPLLGDLMPPFQAQTVSGNPVISGAYEGHTVILSFVSTKCDPCERALAAAQSVYADEREVVAVAVFRPDDAGSARSVAAKLALHYPVVVDGDGSIARHFQIQEVPSTFVIDGGGRVRWIGGSDITEDTLTAAVHAFD